MDQNDFHTLREWVYQSIKQDILMGPYDLQEQLYLEELAEKFGISKTPIKEAMGRLEAEGLVMIRPRVGYFTTSITLKDVQDLYETRIILETTSAKLAATRITEASLRYLESIESTYTPGDPTTYLPWIQYNHTFHHNIALATNNSYLAEFVGSNLDRLQRAQWLRLDLPPSVDDVMDRHRRILGALRKREPEEAAEAMNEDIVSARNAALQRITESPEMWRL